MPIRKPPGLELPPPPGLEFFAGDGQAPAKEADCDALSFCSTADTAERGAVSVPPSPPVVPAGYTQDSLLQGTLLPKPRLVLELEKCVEQPSVGQLPSGNMKCLPSLGSVGHSCGLCRPCEFFHKNRCTAGADCMFCHLCGPDEPKARRKAKKAAMRMKSWQQWPSEGKYL